MSRQAHSAIRWFSDSPDAGDPHCVCSYCGERIEESPEGEEDRELNADEGEPVRMWTNGGKAPCLEARFHAKCLEACLELGLLTMEKGGSHGAPL